MNYISFLLTGIKPPIIGKPYSTVPILKVIFNS